MDTRCYRCRLMWFEDGLLELFAMIMMHDEGDKDDGDDNYVDIMC